MVSLRENAITLLSETNVDLSSATQTTIYTVPVGKRLVITEAVFVFDSSPNSSTITLGQSGALTDFLPTQTLSNPTAQYDAVVMRHIDGTPNTPDVLKSYAAGTTIQVDVTAANGGATNTFYLFGFLY